MTSTMLRTMAAQLRLMVAHGVPMTLVQQAAWAVELDHCADEARKVERALDEIVDDAREEERMRMPRPRTTLRVIEGGRV